MNELMNAVQHEIAYYDDRDKIGISESAIRRDLREIRNKFLLNIKYSKAENGYFIDEEDGMSKIESMLEPLNLLSALYMDKKLPDFLFIEKRKPKGMDNMPMLIHSIKNSLVTEFLYVKFDNSSSRTRTVEPYALKEFKGGWYLLAMEIEERDFIKTWGLDRIENLWVTNQKFWKKPHYDLNDLNEGFADSFGIFSDCDKEPEEVILSFTPTGGKYNASYPLHESQETLIDNDKEFRIRLKVKLTYDFIMELLSQSENMNVIAPEHLKNRLIDIHKNAIKMLESGKNNFFL